MTTTTRRDPERRAQLLSAADRAIATHGAGVRMEDIAAEAGVTKPILYRHFGDKGGLYEAVARRAARIVEERLEEALAEADGPREKLRTTIDAFLAAVEERPETYRFLLHSAATERPEVSQAVGDFTHELGRRLAGVLREQFARYGLEVRHSRGVRTPTSRSRGRSCATCSCACCGRDCRRSGSTTTPAPSRRPPVADLSHLPRRVRVARRLALNPAFRTVGKVVVPRVDRVLNRLTRGACSWPRPRCRPWS